MLHTVLGAVGLLGQTEQVGLDPVGGNRTPSLFPFYLPEEDAQELNDHLVDGAP